MPAAQPAPSAQPSNVLVFLCDQLRLDLLGCYGGTLVRTPSIDALAADGVVFERAYTPTAICSPARASLLTGLYAHAHHMFNNSTPRYSYCEHLRPGLTTLDAWIADHTAYESAYFGKWHIGPADDLFGSRFHHTQRPDDSDRPFLTSSHWHPSTSLGPLVRSVAGGKAGTLDVPLEGFPDVVAARYAQRFLRERDRARPFVLFCSFPGPHSPWMVPEEFGIRYDPRSIPVWANRNDTFEGKPVNQQKLRLLDAERAAHAQPDDALQELLACCFSYLELIDGMLGQPEPALPASCRGAAAPGRGALPPLLRRHRGRAVSRGHAAARRTRHDRARHRRRRQRLPRHQREVGSDGSGPPRSTAPLRCGRRGLGGDPPRDVRQVAPATGGARRAQRRGPRTRPAAQPGGSEDPVARPAGPREAAGRPRRRVRPGGRRSRRRDAHAGGRR